MTIRYLNVVNAARETTTKIVARRSVTVSVTVNAEGGNTASVFRQGGLVTLRLPSLPADAILSRSEADQFVAYIGHEMCHVLHTDWTVNPSQLPPRVMVWANALEDVRIEAKELAEGPFKGLRGLIESLTLSRYAEALAMMQRAGKVLGEDINNAPYIVTLLGRLANGYSLAPITPLAGKLSPSVKRLTDYALAKLPGCQNTRDCVALAHELVKMEGGFTQQAQGQQQDAQGQGKPQQGQQEPGQGDEGEPGEASENASGEPQDGDGPEGESATEGQGNSNNGGGEPQGKGKKGKGGEGAGGKDTPEISPDVSLSSAVKDIAKRNPGHHGNAAQLNDIKATHVTPKPAPYTNTAAESALNSLLPSNSVLHGQIARLLVSEERNQRTHHESSGRLDRRAIVRMRTGAQDVFSRREYMPGNDTAVMVLVDTSGSMSNSDAGQSRMTLAKGAVWAIAKAAESAGGKLAIAGFKGNTTITRLIVVKDFTQPVSNAAGEIWGSLHATGSTPLSASIVTAAQDLANVQATRRILMVVTDGMCDLGADTVQAACRLASDYGVETVGIGIACEAVTAAFPARYSVNVKDATQLAASGLGALVSMLEEAAGEA
jgi:hypothetical protein